jgi:hypothetical protein
MSAPNIFIFQYTDYTQAQKTSLQVRTFKMDGPHGSQSGRLMLLTHWDLLEKAWPHISG